MKGLCMNSISQLVARAVEHGDWDELVPSDDYIKDSLGFTIPKDGFKGSVSAIEVSFNETAKGYPYIGIQCQTEENISFWTNLYFSQNDSSNLITQKNLSVWGVTPEFLEENPNDEEAIADQIKGMEAVNVRIRHQEGDDDRIFLRPTFSPMNDDDGLLPDSEFIEVEDTDTW